MKTLNPNPAEGDAECRSLEQSQPAPPEPYAVGYKRPPRHTRFQKGRSGNPRGRPKGAVNVATIVTKMTSTSHVVRIDGQKKRMSGAEIVLQQLFKKAMTGDHKAAQLVINLIRENETKEARAAAASATSTAPDASAAPDETLGEIEAAILAHHYRSELAEGGLDERAIERALITFGLVPKETDR